MPPHCHRSLDLVRCRRVTRGVEGDAFDPTPSRLESQGAWLARAWHAIERGGGGPPVVRWRRGRLVDLGELEKEAAALGSAKWWEVAGPAPVCVIHIGSGAHHGRDR